MSAYKNLLSFIFFAIALLVTDAPCHSQELQQESAKLSPRELVILYTKTKMDLAKVELDWLLEKSAGVIPAPRVERQKSDLAVAKEQYNQAMLASSGGLEKVRLCHAAEKVRLAKLQLTAGKNLREKNALSELGLKRLQLQYELAELNLAMLQNPENYVTLIEALQGQIDRMGQELVAIDLRLTKLEDPSLRR